MTIVMILGFKRSGGNHVLLYNTHFFGAGAGIAMAGNKEDSLELGVNRGAETRSTIMLNILRAFNEALALARC